MKKSIAASYFNLRFLFSFIFLLVSLTIFHFFLQERPGKDCIVFNDPFFQWLPFTDWSTGIFLLTWGSVMLFIWFSYRTPSLILRFIDAYSLLVVLRMASIALVPLCPPTEVIPLNDPFLNNFFYPEGYSSYDLFFSGHAATLVLCFFLSDKWKWYFFFAGIVLSIMLIAQHVHYSIDILPSPFVVGGIYWLMNRSVFRKLYPNGQVV